MLTYHVSVMGSDLNSGTEDYPFRTISRAASVADAGDTVVVHGGEYREWVRPVNSGKKLQRITYTAADGEKVVIKGSEPVTGWQDEGNGVWKVTIPNSFFRYGNPFDTVLKGDWLIYPVDYALHTADVYLNGKSLYEAPSLKEVENPVKREEGFNPPWTKHREKIADSDFTVYTWYASVDNENTTVWANFHGYNPNEEIVEVNVRPAVFYPERTGINYITVRGFELCQAATQWAPPTADQPGLIGPHWAKGWIIEDCDIHDSKCSAVSLGKEISTGHNESTRYYRKPGYHYQMEVVFRALESGWSKERTGGHIVRNNRIHDNGQNGIVGHLGCIFSEIYNNEIWNIATKHENFGYEIAGIKLHAALDVQIHDNYIHDTTLGIWLDWQAQGARVSRNIFRKNDRDLFVEVTHGPYIVDNNIFASGYNFDNIAQGGAYINNLCCGTMRREPVLDRSTPYHFPHTTKVAGTTIVYSGDDRIIRNIYIGGAPVYTEQSTSGTADYNGCPASMEEYSGKVRSLGNDDHSMFALVKQPVYISGNVSYNGAKSYEKESGAVISEKNPGVRFTEEGDGLYIEFDADESLLSAVSPVCSSDTLPTPRITECEYENPDGTPIVFDTDITGCKRDRLSPPGPFAAVVKGHNRIKIWG